MTSAMRRPAICVTIQKISAQFLSSCFFLLFLASVAHSQETIANPAASFVTTESAEYRGRVSGEQITGGKFAFQIVRRGTGNAWIDWSSVRIAMSNLAWEKQALIAGTATDERILLRTQRDSDLLTGDWSLVGQRIGQTVVFDLYLPPSLNNRVLLDVPASLRIESKQGLLQSGEIDEETRTRLWTLELGGVSTASIQVIPVSQKRAVPPPRYEIDTEYRARRDGVFIRADLTIDGALPTGTPLKIDLPSTLEVQSISLVGAGPQGLSNIPFQRPPNEPRVLLIPPDSWNPESNAVLRIRAFEPVIWQGSRNLPRLRLDGALETKRSVTLRVEPPLELQAIDPGDLLQTALMSNETVGEVWRLESRDPSTELNVRIGLPEAQLTGEVTCLSDAEPNSGWTVAIVTLNVESGSRFETSMQLPEDWRLISVSAHDTDSRIASWEVTNQVLSVTWQNALTRTSPRQLRLFARTAPRRERTPFRLSVLQIRGVHDLTVQYQLLLPPGTELQLLEGENWRSGSANEILPILSGLREVTERVPTTGQLNVATLKASGENRAARVLATIVPRNSNDPSLNDASLTAAAPFRSDAPSEESTSSTEAKAVTVSSPAVALELLTMAGQENPRECVHHAVMVFDRLITPSELQLRLPAACRLSVVKLDDQPITVFRTQDTISIPAEFTQASRIQLTYITPATFGWLNQQFVVPLPRIAFPIQSFRWSLDLPGGQQLSQVRLPGGPALGEPQPQNTSSLFGPLSRGAGERTFNPFSPTAWSNLLGLAGSQKRELAQSRRIWHFVAPGVSTEAVFTTWNGPVARSYAWVTLFGSLLLGMTARLFRMTWLKNVSILWVLLLIVLVTQVPPAWGLVLGGLLAGSLLSLVLPRQWIQRQDLLSRRKLESLPVPTTITLLMIFCGMTLHSKLEFPWSPAVANAQETSVVTSPNALIRSARYQLLKVRPVAQVNATLEVLTRQNTGEILLKLPLQDVVFHADATCLVNDIPRSLIPSISGDSILISLDETVEAAGSPIAGTDWTRHEILLNFSLRSYETDGENGAPSTRGRVPRVLDSLLILPEKQPDQNWLRYGEERVNSNGAVEIQLGAIGLLETASTLTDPPENEASAQSIQSSLDVSARRVRCLSRLQPTMNGWPRQLPLTFPEGTVITSITGPNVIDWIDTTASETTSQMTVRLRSDLPPQPLLVTYEFPVNPGMDATLTIPELPLVSPSTVPHSMGITGPPLTTLSLTNRAGIVSLTTDEWQPPSETGRLRPSLIVLLKTPMPIGLDLTRMKSHRSAEINEILRVQRDSLNYTAIIKMNVADAPAFRHQFHVDPFVHLESVNTGQMGNDGSVRFTRDGDLVTLYLAGGHLGERTFHLKGRIPSIVDVWGPVPAIQLENAAVTDRQLTIEDETGWNVELEGDRGTPISIAEGQNSNPSPSANSAHRLVGTFRAGLRPKRLRVVVPSRAIQAEIVTVVQTHPQQDWEQISTIHFTSVEAPLRRILIQIPPDLIATRVRPSLFPYSMQPYGQDTLLTIRVPERYSSSATVTISSRLTSDFMKRIQSEEAKSAAILLPQIQIPSAAVTSRYVLTESASRLQLGGAVRVSSSILPNWLPAEWIRSVQSEVLTCFHQNQPELTLQRMAPTESGNVPVIRLEETIFWPTDTLTQKGITRWWLLPKGTSKFQFAPAAGISIDQIMSPSGQLSYDLTPEGVRVTLPAGQNLVPVVVHWTSEGTKKQKPILESEQTDSHRRMMAIVTPQPWTVSIGNGTRLDPATIWLERSAALLQCWQETGPTAEAAALIFSNLQRCQMMLEQLVKTGALSKSQLKTHEELSAQWQEIRSSQQTLMTTNSTTADPSNDLFDDILTQPSPSTTQVNWIRPTGGDWTGRVTVRRSGIHWRSLIPTLGLLILCAWTLWRFPQQVARLREEASSHPLGMLLCLGILWWLYFSPSAFGLLLILISSVALSRQRFPRWWTPAPEEESFG
ncbi:MAG TPA: hypothetical protein VNQ76_02225 [Planctomicrobium sp.]|nr:hypothetical protein [Planctomicrobium sp.]